MQWKLFSQSTSAILSNINENAFSININSGIFSIYFTDTYFSRLLTIAFPTVSCENWAVRSMANNYISLFFCASHDRLLTLKCDVPWKPHNSRCHTHKSVISNLVQWPAAALGSNVILALFQLCSTSFWSLPLDLTWFHDLCLDTLVARCFARFMNYVWYVF